MKARSNIVKSLLLTTGTVGLALYAIPANAQNQSGNTGQSGIEDIVVTARRVSESLQTTPVAVTAVTAAGLERAQINDVNQLANIAPGLIVAPNAAQQQALSIGIRGQIQTDSLITLDPSVAIYLDGVYVARSSGALFNLVDLERVEVLRGPQGTLFGRNTTGGAVNLIAKKPTDKLEGSARIRGGNYDMAELTGVINVPLTAGIDARFAYQHSERKGYVRDLYTNTRDNADNTEFLRGQIRFKPENTGLDVTFSGDYTDRHGSGQATKLLAVRPGATAFANFLPGACNGSLFGGARRHMRGEPAGRHLCQLYYQQG